MTYHGLGVCPGKPGVPTAPDPCPFTYPIETNIPILGDFKVQMPLNTLVRDSTMVVRDQLRSQLPGIVDEMLPVVFDRALPYIEWARGEARGEVRTILDEDVMPRVEAIRDETLDQVKTLAQQAAVVTLVIGLGAGAAWWYLRKR